MRGHQAEEKSLWFRIGGKNIGELASMDLTELRQYLDGVTGDMSERQRKIASEILKEITSRLGFLLDVGLYYLSLNRGARTLSGGGEPADTTCHTDRVEAGQRALYP